MEGPSSTPEVVVIGGGPAGSVASTVLADAGHRLVVLETARAHGADVREAHAVTAVETGGPTPVVHVERAGGVRLTLAPRFVIDASGQTALIGRAKRLRRFDEFFKNLAIFGYFLGADR